MNSGHMLSNRYANGGALIARATRFKFVAAAILAFLFTANIYDPSGAFRIKYVAFFVACLFSFWTLQYVDLSVREIAAGLFLFVAWPTWSLLYGAARGGILPIGLSQVTPFLFLWLLASLLPYFDKQTPLRIFYACIFSLAVFVIVSFGLVFLWPNSSMSGAVYDMLVSLHGREGYFGTRSWGDVDVPIFYFGSTLFLVPTCVYYLFIGKMLRAGAVFLAIAVTWSKAGILIVLVFGVIYFATSLVAHPFLRLTGGAPMKRQRFFRILAPVILLAVISSSILISFPQFFDYVRYTVAGESETSLVRIEHYHSVLGLFARSPHYLLVGQGAGVPFFTSGESEYVNSIELDYLDAIRKFGLPWFLGFSLVVFLSAWRLIKTQHIETRAFGFALISMYVAAGTNPVLLTPLFIMLMTLSYFSQRFVHGTSSSHSVGDLQRI